MSIKKTHEKQSQNDSADAKRSDMPCRKKAATAAAVAPSANKSLEYLPNRKN